MKSQGQVVLGIAMIVVGVLAILDRWLGISLGRVVFPLLLVALGVWVIVRPSRVAAGTRVSQQLFGDLVRRDTVSDEDILLLLGDVKIDWLNAVWPDGSVHVRVSNLLGDVRVTVPRGVGVRVRSSALISSLRLEEQKKDTFATTIVLQTNDYEASLSRLDLEVTHLLGDVRVDRGEPV